MTQSGNDFIKRWMVLPWLERITNPYPGVGVDMWYKNDTSIAFNKSWKDYPNWHNFPFSSFPRIFLLNGSHVFVMTHTHTIQVSPYYVGCTQWNRKFRILASIVCAAQKKKINQQPDLPSDFEIFSLVTKCQYVFETKQPEKLIITRIIIRVLRWQHLSSFPWLTCGNHRRGDLMQITKSQVPPEVCL